MNLNCEYVRDTYPDVLHGAVDDALAQRIRAHVAECAECRVEVALIDAIHAERLVVPPGLEQRTAHAATARRPRWRVSASTVAMAATLAAALIGGSLIMNSQNDQPAAVPAAAGRAPNAAGIGAVGVDAAMMSGKSSLDDLSVEQLEKLLGEMQS